MTTDDETPTAPARTLRAMNPDDRSVVAFVKPEPRYARPGLGASPSASPTRFSRSSRPVADETGGPENLSDAQLIAAWQQFRRAMGALDNSLARSLAAADAPDGLMHEALAALAAAPTRMLPMIELARTLGVSAAGLTELVDRLTDRGFAYRHVSNLDQRDSFAALTDQGAHYEASNTPVYAERLRTEFTVLGVDQMAALQQICVMIDHRFSADDRQDPAGVPGRAKPM